MAGYSGTPLVKKLGLKSGMRAAVLQAPTRYASTLGELPAGVRVVRGLQPPLDFIQFFTRRRGDLECRIRALSGALADRGMLWVSWPKKAAKVETDVTENVVRSLGLAHGLVDVKVCAVDEIWSGLKLVRRRSKASQH